MDRLFLLLILAPAHGLVTTSSTALRASPFAFADVVEPKETTKTTLELAKLATGELAQRVDAATSTLEELDAKREETLEKTASARRRAKEARMEASKLVVKATTIKTSRPDVESIIADGEAQAAALRAEEREARDRALTLARARGADVAEGLRFAKTDLSAAEKAALEAEKDLASLKAKDDTLVNEAKEAAQRQVANAEARAAFTLDVGVVEPKIAVPVAALAGLLVADFIGLDDLDIFLAAGAAALMLFNLPPADALPTKSSA